MVSWPIYRHYKGGHYLRLGTAAHSEDLAPHIVYRCLYDNPAARTWVRPEGMFNEALPDGTPRFRPIGALHVAGPSDEEALLAFGYDAWAEGRTRSEFLAYYQTSPNFLRGTRYYLTVAQGQAVAKLNALRWAKGMVGLASVATEPSRRRQGHAALLLRAVMELHRWAVPSVRFVLFAEAAADLYTKQGFRPVPTAQQHFPPAVAMVTGEAELSPEAQSLLKTYF